MNEDKIIKTINEEIFLDFLNLAEKYKTLQPSAFGYLMLRNTYKMLFDLEAPKEIQEMSHAAFMSAWEWSDEEKEELEN